jgi:hypothetical protein
MFSGGSCEHSSRLRGSLKEGEILDQLDDSRLDEKDLEWTWNYFLNQSVID